MIGFGRRGQRTHSFHSVTIQCLSLGGVTYRRIPACSIFSAIRYRGLLFRLRDERAGLRTGENSLFLAVESLYSMDGTFAPLREMADLLDEVFPLKNGYLVVDEAHAAGIYGP